MARFIPDTILDLMLDQCEGTTLHVCDNQPTTFADLSTMTIGSKAIPSITPGAGTPTGRQNDYSAVADIDITMAGTNVATHVAVSSTGPDTLHLVTTCTNQALTQGGTVSTTNFIHTLTDPSA